MQTVCTPVPGETLSVKPGVGPVPYCLRDRRARLGGRLGQPPVAVDEVDDAHVRGEVVGVGRPAGHGEAAVAVRDDRADRADRVVRAGRVGSCAGRGDGERADERRRRAPRSLRRAARRRAAVRVGRVISEVLRCGGRRPFPGDWDVDRLLWQTHGRAPRRTFAPASPRCESVIGPPSLARPAGDQSRRGEERLALESRSNLRATGHSARSRRVHRGRAQGAVGRHQGLPLARRATGSPGRSPPPPTRPDSRIACHPQPRRGTHVGLGAPSTRSRRGARSASTRSSSVSALSRWCRRCTRHHSTSRRAASPGRCQAAVRGRPGRRSGA